jgi:hypothetical protein
MILVMSEIDANLSAGTREGCISNAVDIADKAMGGWKRRLQ